MQCAAMSAPQSRRRPAASRPSASCRRRPSTRRAAVRRRSDAGRRTRRTRSRRSTPRRRAAARRPSSAVASETPGCRVAVFSGRQAVSVRRCAADAMRLYRVPRGGDRASLLTRGASSRFRSSPTLIAAALYWRGAHARPQRPAGPAPGGRSSFCAGIGLVVHRAQLADRRAGRAALLLHAHDRSTSSSATSRRCASSSG